MLILLAVGLFLPLFPLSMPFNLLYGVVRRPLARAVLLLAWPGLGLALIHGTGAPLPWWVTPWALATSLLYALRALALRELGQWTSFIATSAWALLWLPLAGGTGAGTMAGHALGFALPLALLALLGGGVERRFGAAYGGVTSGLAVATPRLSALLVVTVLAVVATPLAPAFFTMLGTIVASVVTAPQSAAVIALVWLLWSWAAARLLQGLVVGEPELPGTVPDLSPGVAAGYGAALVALAAGGLVLAGGLA